MDLLTTSPSYASTSLPTRNRTLFSKPPISSFNPKTSFPSPCSQSRITPPRPRGVFATTTSPKASKNSTFESIPQTPRITFQLSAPLQSPEAAMMGAETDAMGMLLRERIVFLGNEIDDFVADAIVSQLLLLDAQDPTKDIKLFINSPGGSVSAAMAVYDAVQLVRADVSTIALGIAASTASIILGGGTKGKRLAMPNTRIMIVQPPGGISGQVIDVAIQAKEIMQNKNNIARIISTFSGRSFEQVLKDFDRDRYMSPIEAVEYGIIDGVIDGDKIIPILPLPEVPDDKKLKAYADDFLIPNIPDDEIY